MRWRPCGARRTEGRLPRAGEGRVGQAARDGWMLTKRIIPCLDVTAGRVVKGVSFVNLRDAGDPVGMAALYKAEGADGVGFLDITAPSDERETWVDVVGRTADRGVVPRPGGGGVGSVGDLRRRR